MTDKTVAEKAHVKAGAAIAVINRVPRIVESLGLPANVAFVRPSDAQLVFLFVRTRAELERRMPSAAAAMAAGAALWVFFRKGSSNASLDMNRDTVWALAERLDMRPLGLVSVDDVWSAFRLKRVGAKRGSRSRKSGSSTRGRPGT